MAVCIVCDTEFDDQAEETSFKFNHNGKWYKFNDIGCRNRFIGDPSKFLNPETAQA